MTFAIDTGAGQTNWGHLDTATIIANAAADAAGHSATAEEIGIETAHLIIARIWESKKPETVRRHLCTLWPIIAPLAITSPDAFDRILQEFSERSNEFR